MSFTIQTAVVNVSGSVTSTASTYTLSVASTSWTDTNAHTVGTVPANKRWKVVGLQVTNTGVATTSTMECLVQLNGVTWLDASIKGIATYPTGAVNFAVSFDVNYCPIITAGQTVAVPAQSSTGYKGVVCYYIEESV